MNYLGVAYDLKHRPKLDPDFIPFGIWMNEYEKGATTPIAIAVERNDGFISVRRARVWLQPVCRPFIDAVARSECCVL